MPSYWAADTRSSTQRELSANEPMLTAIRNAHAEGIKILAECGEFLHLRSTWRMKWETGRAMAGLDPPDGFRTEKLSRLDIFL